MKAISILTLLFSILFSTKSYGQDLAKIEKYQDSIKTYYQDLRISYDHVLDNGYSSFMVFQKHFKTEFSGSMVTFSYDDIRLDNDGVNVSVSFDLKKVDSLASNGYTNVEISKDEFLITSIVIFVTLPEMVDTIYKYPNGKIEKQASDTINIITAPPTSTYDYDFKHKENKVLRYLQAIVDEYKKGKGKISSFAK